MTDEKKNSLWQKLRALGLGTIAVAFAGGIVFWGGFNTVMEWTNTEKFCISCHEMQENVYKEYRNTIHYQNRTGVRAICSDCHVPKEWIPKMIRKIQASKEVYGKVMGTIDTPEKFREHRLRLAQNEWRRMKANDSRECRNCHSYEYFDYSVQGRRSNQSHQAGLAEGKTCIDCHKGIAHSLPPIEQDIGLERPSVAPDVFHPPSTQQR
ncbi:NapC/NirT family cytochrome c [Pseudothauera rhizosphaerae]|uniref:Cytochrome c-type protein n=1 Tax=Pseudothauera rhizosphaerae TaxID=2565932 RepID=A0A4S4ALJ9_9RHOO|nr:NapC/NirT family cytochrome c [Pseudothauera rhizosphaerae]THF60312.1 cytochrome c-type protein NapC [Pseudothauera rhizosphaerae]